MTLDRRTFLAASAAGAAALPFGSGQAFAGDEQDNSFQGEIPDSAVNGERSAKLLGRAGVLLIRSAAHLKWVFAGLSEAGYLPPKGKSPPSADFAKEVIVMILHYGDEGNRFTVRQVAANETRAKVDVAMSYIIYKSRGRVVNKFQFLAVPAPRREAIDAFISTYHPQNGGPYPTLEKANKEWSHDFTADRGDLVDGLHARLIPEKREVARGDDIRLGIQLNFHSPMKEAGQFGQPATSAFVWDGKYSNGYRNHAFLVEFPDGSSKEFRPAEIGNWDKNAPHPVEVAAGKPYTLPEWSAGQTFKSLQKLGLETKAAGKYTITGLYTESAALARAAGGKDVTMWGGRVATAPVVVTVK